MPKPSPPQLVPAPFAGLRGYSNYIFYSNCHPLVNLSVTISVTTDIVCESAIPNSYYGPGSMAEGFGFQLNAYSPKNISALQPSWQQYVMTLIAPQGFAGAVACSQNYSSSLLFLQQTPLAPMPLKPTWPGGPLVPYALPTIPSGYKLRISLQNDSQNNVSMVTYLVIDNLGNTLANPTVALVPSPGAFALAPVLAFQLDLVGPILGEFAVLSSGAGTITYAATGATTAEGYPASTGLFVWNEEKESREYPDCVTGVPTAEDSNSSYGFLFESAQDDYFLDVITQSFTVGSTDQGMIRKPRRSGPGLFAPPGPR